MSYTVCLIKVDTNDADYIERQSIVETTEQKQHIVEVANALNNFQPYTGYGNRKHEHNFPIGDCRRDNLGEMTVEEIYVESGMVSAEAIETFRKFLPFTEFGFHTVESVNLIVVESNQEIFKRKRQ